MKLEEIKTAGPFNSLFPIDAAVLGQIQQNMQEKGFDKSQPIITWTGKGIVIDGHTRYQAAKTLGLEEVPVVEKEFEDEDAALEYAIHNQRHRRNLTEAVLLTCIEALDRRLNRGGDRRSVGVKSKAPSGAIEKSAQSTAKILGVSSRKVERARTVLADPQATAEVKAGKKSIHRACQESRAKSQDKSESNKNREDERQAILQKALAELRTWRQKFGEYPELSVIFEVIDEYQLNQEPWQPLPEVEVTTNASEPLEPLAFVAGVDEVGGTPQVHDVGNELPGCCTVESTGEPALPTSEIGDPESEDRAVVDPGESGIEGQGLIECGLCQHFVLSVGAPAGRGRCNLEKSWDGKSTQFSDVSHPCTSYNCMGLVAN